MSALVLALLLAPSWVLPLATICNGVSILLVALMLMRRP